MKPLHVLGMLGVVALLLTACRIGGGFDSAGRLQEQPLQVAEVSAPEAKPEQAETAEIAPLIYYITPAG
jgi:hypothetical protein